MKLQKLNKIDTLNNSASQLAKCTCYCYCFISVATGKASQGNITGLTVMAAEDLYDWVFKRS